MGVALGLWWPMPARAGVEPTRLAGWTAQRWTTEDGLPSDEVRAVAFDGDGLAWIATLGGLARFDGVAFEVHTPGTDPGLPSARFQDVAVVGGDIVWAATEGGGLARDRGHGFEAVPVEDIGLGAAYDLVETSLGWWVLGRDALASIEGGDLRVLRLEGDAAFTTPLGLLDEDAPGLWVLDAIRGVHRLDPASGRLTRLGEVPEPDFALAGLARSPGRARTVLVEGDALWSADPGGVVYRDASGRSTRFPASGALLLHAVDGSVLVTTASGVECVERGALRPLDGAPPLAPGTWWTRGARLYRGPELVFEGQAALALLAEGPLGEAWVAELGHGLLHVHAGPVAAVQDDALGRIGPVDVVMVDASGGLWVGAQAGLRRHVEATAQAVVTAEGKPVAFPTSLLERRDGSVIVGTRGGTCRVAEVRSVGPLVCRGEGLEGAGAAVLSMLETGDGATWFGGVGLRRMGPGGAMEPMLTEVSGANPFGVLAEAPDGSILAASHGIGLFRIRDRVAELRAEPANGPLRVIRAVVFDDAGDAWLGTEGHGVCRLALSRAPNFADAPLQCAGERAGVRDGFVNSLAPDHWGRLWMSSNPGLHAVPRAALGALLDGRGSDVSTLSLGRADGLLETETNGVSRPSVARGVDGSLWYPTMDGVARLDPAAVDFGAPPRPVLQSVAAPPRALRARWTAAEFVHPDQLQFRYRLSGLDTQWRAPSADRSAEWASLPPGNYRLEVQSGWGERWSDSAFGPTLVIAPTFRETIWYPLAIGLVGMSLVALAGAARLRAARRRSEALARAVEVATAEVTRQNAVLMSQADALVERNARVAAQAERLAGIDEARTRFVANVSHELRTPLTLVRGILADTAGTAPDAVRQPLQTAARNADRLAALVEQLLDVARVDEGGVRLRARRTDLAHLAARVCRGFDAAARARNVQLRLALAPGVAAWLDPDLVEKVITNLVSNGLEHCPAGGWLEVAVVQRGDEEDVGIAELRVTDTGPGVAPELRERVFDRFFRGDDDDRRRRGGVGIGLSLARELVTLHGGTLTVGDAPGAGACFVARFPLGSAHLGIEEVGLAPPGADAAAAPSPSQQENEDSLPLALVVEDHDDMRAYIAEHLAESFRVVTAIDGEDALGQLRGGLRPAVIVSDVMMPRLDGLSLCRELSADPALASLPVMLVSAKATEDDRVAGLSLAADYLTKPFRAPDLVARARRLAEGRLSPVSDATGDPAGEARAAQAATSEPSLYLARLVEIVQSNLSDPEFGAARLARRAGASPRQLLRRIQEETGMTVAAWIRELRLREARARIQDGRARSVAEAADAVGLNPSYLARVYRAWAGRRPSEDLTR